MNAPVPQRLLPLSVLAVGLLGCLLAPLALAEDKMPPEAKPADAKPADAKPATVGKDVGHMHNVHAVTPRFVRGSQPETEQDFAELAKMGVKVVVSVDGAKPDLASAHKHGLRYVHVPMGYDGPSRAQEVLLYKAFTTLKGPFFVHCHHGRHRGPAACAIGLMAVEGWSPAQVVEEMVHAGTARKYEGLYAFPAAFKVPTAEELAACPAEIPETAPVPGFVDAMVHIDASWVRLGQVRAAAWKVPADHPDVSPRHEATIFAEHFRELARLDDVAKAPENMATWTKASEQAAWDLAKALEADAPDAAKADEAYARIERACTDCHKQFRDTPKGREAR